VVFERTPAAVRRWYGVWAWSPAVHSGALAGLTHALLDGLEEIHVQPGEVIDAGQLRIGGFGSQAIIADELAPFFGSTWALSFFFQARRRVKVMPSRRQ
jgi:hypothetical protein